MNQAVKIITVINPKWLSEGLRQRLIKEGKLVYTLHLSKAERKTMRKRKPIPVSKWAEEHRVLTMSSLPGPWHNSVTPYLTDIMDASGLEFVDTIILCKAPQGGGSEAAHNFIGSRIDLAPGPVLYVYPDENTARENSKDRILPMIQSSPRLRSYLTGVQDDASSLRINLRHMPIYLAWASSASRLANKPIRYLIEDEIDKYPDTSGKREADPQSLGEKRTTTYKWNRKIWKISTTTIESGNIWVALNHEAREIFDFMVCCPDCGQYQIMDFDHIKWPENERDFKKIEDEYLAWYECRHCGSSWGDAKKNMAVRMGHWHSRKTDMELMECLNKHRFTKIGFHMPAWIYPFVSLSETAAAYLKGQKKYNPANWKSCLKDFMNNYKAEPWVDYHQERSEARILALCDDRPAGIVPAGGVVAGLTAAVDTQDDGFWYEIRAHGWGLTQESWGVREGYLPSFESVVKVLWEDVYKDANGNEYIILLTIQDAMGHRTSDVYDFCRLRGGILPFQGVDRLTAPYAYTNIEYYPGTKKPIPGGIRLLRANVNYYKDKLSGLLQVAPGDPGAWHYHSELSEAWAKHMTVEYVDEKGLWQCPEGKANHGWDCSVLNLVAADVLGIKHWRKPEEAEGVKQKNIEQANKNQLKRKESRW
jgi:phage terminase large subunit GpA-like protein